MSNEKKNKSGFKMPHIYVIYSYSVSLRLQDVFNSAGEFDRVELENGRSAVDPESFTYVESTPTGAVNFYGNPKRFSRCGRSCLLHADYRRHVYGSPRKRHYRVAVDKLARKFSSRSILIIPVLITVFASIATLIGTAELSLVYIPVIIPLIIALGYDSMTAAAIALCGTVVGYSVGVLIL